MEFKKLSAVETVDSVSDTARVLIEDQGVIKRAPKDAVGGTKKELLYEWTFTEDNATDFILENVDKDLSPLFADKDAIFELACEGCVLEQFLDEETGNWSDATIIPGGVSTWNSTDISFVENVPCPLDTQYTASFISMYSYGYDYGASTDTHQSWCPSRAEALIVNGVHFNIENGTTTKVPTGGFVVVESDCPLKSVKIYRVTK